MYSAGHGKIMEVPTYAPEAIIIIYNTVSMGAKQNGRF